MVKVDAVMLLPESVNRSVAHCSESGQPAVCVDIRVCFRVGGKQIPGNIGKTVTLIQREKLKISKV